MYNIDICNNSLPVIYGCDFLAASEPFYHADRVTDFNVLIYVTEGVIHVTEGDTDYAVGAGELLFLKAGVRHYGKSEIPRGTKWYFIHFTSQDDSTLPLFTPDSTAIPQYTRVQHRLTLPKYLRGLSGGATEKRIAALIEYFHSDDRFRRWQVNQLLFGLLSSIGLGEYETRQSEILSDKICEFLARNMREPFSAERISAQFYLSYKRLAAVFKQEKGISMQQYHTELRMNEACRLLRSTLMSIGEIAEAVGFADPLYFSRCFHASVGYSPSEYRKLPPVY